MEKSREQEAIQVTRSSMPEFSEYVEEIKDLWESRFLTNMGVKHQKLEGQLSKYLDSPNVKLFTNGHLALETVIRAYELKGEVITTPFTFASTTHAIVRNGLTPVFCDINGDDYTMDVHKIEALITERTSAIIPVHVYGHMCDVQGIEAIGKKYNLKVIYDAAHAFGITVEGVNAANFGDASMFSFHATKVFNTIEGGAIAIKDESIAQKLNYIKNFGITGFDRVDYVGTNAKMNEFQAAMGLCNLKHIDAFIQKRSRVVQRYKEHLRGVEGIKIVETPPSVQSNYAYFPVVFDNYKYTRDEILNRLKEHNIFARKYFYPLISDFDCYKDDYNSGLTPIAKFTAERVLTLPLYAELGISDVDRICDIIKN